MNSTLSSNAPPIDLRKADRVGVAASVLCAIHCALAPILLLALPTFGKIWAHPASHILVAIFVVPLAAFSIWKGYQTHGRRWILVTASIGICAVLFGAMLPALNKEKSESQLSALLPEDAPEAVAAEDSLVETDGGSCCEESSCGVASNEAESVAKTEEVVGCVDDCCPSLVVNESGETSLHIPPAAIVTTLGGFFLIAAHIGNLCSCGHACRSSRCSTCV